MTNLKLTGFDRTTGAVEFIKFDTMSKKTTNLLFQELRIIKNKIKKDLTGSELSDLVRRKDRILKRLTPVNTQVNRLKPNRINQYNYH